MSAAASGPAHAQQTGGLRADGRPAAAWEEGQQENMGHAMGSVRGAIDGRAKPKRAPKPLARGRALWLTR